MTCLSSKGDGFLLSYFEWSEAQNVFSLWFLWRDNANTGPLICISPLLLLQNSVLIFTCKIVLQFKALVTAIVCEWGWSICKESAVLDWQAGEVLPPELFNNELVEVVKVILMIKFLPLVFLSVSHRVPWKNKNAIYRLQTSALVPEIFKFEKLVKDTNEMTDDVIHSTQYHIEYITESYLGQFAMQNIELCRLIVLQETHLSL